MDLNGITSDPLGPNVDRRAIVNLASKTGESLGPISLVCSAGVMFANSVKFTCF